jgi:hypothetical protein
MLDEGDNYSRPSSASLQVDIDPFNVDPVDIDPVGADPISEIANELLFVIEIVVFYYL